MAKPVGEIIISLDLDPTAYTAGQKKILAGAREAVGSIDAQWRKLGGNCDAYYAAMVQSAINSYNKIAAAAKTSAAEQFRAQSAMVAKINTLNQQMAANPLYETLGIKSQAAYKAQEAAIMASYNTIKNSGTATADDLIRIERAKNEKLKALNKEMAGEHETSMASMTRAVLRFYAAFYVLSSAGQVLGSLFASGLKAIDDLKINTIAVASTLTSLQGTTGNITENYRKNLVYAEALNKKLMEIDANSFANYEQLQLMNRAMNTHGVLLDINKKKQIEAFTAVSNTVALLTTGQNKELQSSQEMNALMSGRVKATDRVAMLIDGIIKQEGKYKGGLKDIVALGQQHGDTLERLAPYLAGVSVASGDIASTWSAVGTSMETAWGILQRGLFKDFYKDATNEGLKFTQWMKDNADDIVKSVNDIKTAFGYATIAAGAFAATMGTFSAIAAFPAMMTALGSAVLWLAVQLYDGTLAATVWGAVTSKSVNAVTFSLKSLFAVAGAGFAGYLVGSWLNQFESVRKFGVAMVYGLIDAFEWLSKTISIGIEYLKVFRDVLSNPVNTKAIWDAGQARISVIKKQYEEEKKIRNEYAAEQFRDVTDQAIKEAKAKADIAKSTATPKIKAKAGVDDASNSAVKEAESVAKRIAEATRRANVEIEGYNQTQYEKDLIRIDSEEEKWREAGATKVDIAKWKAAEITIAENKMYADTTKEALKEFDAWLKLEENKVKERERIAKELAEKPQKEADEARKMVTFYNDLNNMEAEYRNAKLIWIEKEAALKKSKGAEEVAVAKWVAEQKEKLNREQMDSVATKWDYDKKYVNETIANTGRMLDAAMTCYDKESDEYKRLAEAKKVVQVAELAMTAAKNAQIIASNISVAMSNAGAAVTGASIGVGPTGLVTAAAMIALMASVFAMYGIAKGGGSVSVPSIPSYGQNTTVLGGENGQASESIKKSWELMEDTYDMEYEKLTKIHNELKDLNDNITGLVTSIIRTGSIGSIPFEEHDPQTFLNFTETALGRLLTGDFLLPGAAGLINKLFESIFGGGAFAVGKQELWSSSTGIKLGGGRAGDIAGGAGVNARSYQEWTTRTTTDFWREDSYDYNYREQALAQETQNLFNSVFKNVSEVIKELAVGLGQDVNAAMNYVFSPATINLAGMSSEQISSTLNAYISSVGDTAVQAIFGQVLAGYQELGEGLMETAVRLMVDKEIVLEVLAQTNQAYSGSTANAIALSEALIKLAGDLETLTDIASTYYDKFFSEEEKHVRLQEQMTAILGSLNIALPASRQAYRDIVESLDLTTASGQTAYITLLKLAESADTYYSTLEDMADDLVSAAELAAQAIKEVLNATNTAIGEQISLSSAAASAARSAANEYRNIIKSLTDAQESIRGGGLIELTERFEKLFTIAMTGDREALSALPGAADKLLAGSLASSRTALDYARDQGKMLLALEQAKAISEGMVDWNEYHATLLETQVNVLEQIRDELAQGNPNLEALERQAGLLESIGGLLQQQTTAIVNGNGEQVLLLHDQNGIITAANVLTTTQTGQVAIGNSWLEKIKSGVKIESAGVINDYLKSVEQGLIGNNSAEAVAAREAISVLKQTTSDGLIAVSEAKATKEALAVLDQNNVAAQSKLLVAGSSAALQAMNDAATAAQAITSGTSTVTGTINLQRAEIINGNLIIRDQNGLITAANQLLVDQTGKITVGNTLTDEQTAQVITGNATQDAIKNIQSLDTSYSAEMLNALVSREMSQAVSLENILSANNTTVSLLRQLVDLTTNSAMEKSLAEIKSIYSTMQSASTNLQTALSKNNTATQTLAAAQSAASQPPLTLADVLAKNAGTAYSSADAAATAGAYTLPSGRMSKEQLITNLFNAGLGSAITQKEYSYIATNYNDMWEGYGHYYLDASGVLRSAGGGTYHADLGQGWSEGGATSSANITASVQASLAANESAKQSAYAAALAAQQQAMKEVEAANLKLTAAQSEYSALVANYQATFGERPPGYASGGPFSGGLRIVGEQGPELEFTGPSRIYSNSDSKKLLNIDELVAEVKALRAEVKAGNYQLTKYSKTTADVLQRVTRDGESMLTEAA